MSSRLQLDVRNLSLGRHHLVNAYEVKAGIGVIAGNTVWSMPECLACTTKRALYEYTYIYLYLFFLLFACIVSVELSPSFKKMFGHPLTTYGAFWAWALQGLVILTLTFDLLTLEWHADYPCLGNICSKFELSMTFRLWVIGSAGTDGRTLQGATLCPYYKAGICRTVGRLFQKRADRRTTVYSYLTWALNALCEMYSHIDFCTVTRRRCY